MALKFRHVVKKPLDDLIFCAACSGKRYVVWGGGYVTCACGTGFIRNKILPYITGTVVFDILCYAEAEYRRYYTLRAEGGVVVMPCVKFTLKEHERATLEAIKRHERRRSVSSGRT